MFKCYFVKKYSGVEFGYFNNHKNLGIDSDNSDYRNFESRSKRRQLIPPNNHTEGKSLSQDQFNVHQALYTAGLKVHWSSSSCHTGHEFVTMTNSCGYRITSHPRKSPGSTCGIMGQSCAVDIWETYWRVFFR
ncbi:hypothetical protein TNCV_4173841 [Trichonephila clavipes]|nr:hypothetical protein TNCV_4173841 [Trichonephila clavipes]